jgi:tetratricopeptide (TPR) repeat protein
VRTAVERAELQDDLAGALSDLDWAASLAPDAPEVYYCRAQYRLQTNNVVGSLDDYNRLLKLNDRFVPAYMGRSTALQRLNRHREAIDDLTRAIELSPGGDPTPRNNRAYARAIAGLELDEGLVDVNAALARVQQELNSIAGARLGPGLTRFQSHWEESKAMFLDTRATLYLLKGQCESALVDLNEAIPLAEESIRRTAQFDGRNQRPRFQRLHEQSLSVMYHHRGQVHLMLGHASEAQTDLTKGQEMGYDPTGGVY